MKAFHIVAMVAWFSGLFYLPRIFVYHANIKTSDTESYHRFCVMERRLFWGIMTPNAIITLFLGIGLVHLMGYSFKALPLWLLLKLSLVMLLIIYHCFCGVMVKKFKDCNNPYSALFYRIFNEISVIVLIMIVLLVVIKPS